MLKTVAVKKRKKCYPSTCLKFCFTGKSNRTSPTKGGGGNRKMTTAHTIPHIQNIDPFANHFTPSKEVQRRSEIPFF